jgi:hypothetical protein
LLYIITENQNILKKVQPFVEELKIAFARTTKELLDYRIVTDTDTVLIATDEKVSKAQTSKFPRNTQVLTLTKDSVGEDLDVTLLFVKVLGHPRYGTFLHSPEVLISEPVKVVSAAPKTVTEPFNPATVTEKKTSKVVSKPTPKVSEKKEVKTTATFEKAEPVSEERKTSIKIVKENKSINFKRDNIPVSAEVLKGETQVRLVEGQKGIREAVYELTIDDATGKVVSKKELKDQSKVIKEPVNAVYHVLEKNAQPIKKPVEPVVPKKPVQPKGQSFKVVNKTPEAKAPVVEEAPAPFAFEAPTEPVAEQVDTPVPVVEEAPFDFGDAPVVPTEPVAEVVNDAPFAFEPVEDNTGDDALNSLLNSDIAKKLM